MKALLAIAAALLVGAFAGLAYILSGTSTPTVAKHHLPPQDQRAVAEVATHSRGALVELYARWAGQPDKLEARKRALDMLLGDPDPHAALRELLRALAADDTPLDEDPLVAYAANRMKRLWEQDATYRYGRDLMLVQTADKPRVALAHSLVLFVASQPAERDVEGQTRAWLTNDLVDAYYQSTPPARARLVGDIDRLGAADAAKLLDGKTVAELDRVQDQIREIRTTVIDVRARAHDPALADLEEEIERLGTADTDHIENELTQQQ